MWLLFVLLLVHILYWGAFGASLAGRAGLNPWLAAAISIVLPLLGVLVLGGVAISRRREQSPGTAAPAGGAAVALAGIGVVGALLVMSAGWFDWVAAGLEAQLGDVADRQMGVSSDSWGLGVFFSVAGLTLAVGVLLATRLNRRWPVPLVATLAWLPAAVGLSVALAEGPVSDWVEETSELGDAVAVVANEKVDLGGEVNVGTGPILAGVGGTLVLVWGFAWALSSSRAKVADPWAAPADILTGKTRAVRTRPAKAVTLDDDWGDL